MYGWCVAYMLVLLVVVLVLVQYKLSGIAQHE